MTHQQTGRRKLTNRSECASKQRGLNARATETASDKRKATDGRAARRDTLRAILLRSRTGRHNAGIATCPLAAITEAGRTALAEDGVK